MTVIGQPSPDPTVSYRIYYGTNGFSECLSTIQIYSNTVENIVKGITYGVMATAIGTNGLESAPSNTLMFQAP